MILFARIRLLVVAAAVLLLTSVATPSSAQKLGPDGAPNPTASVTSQDTLLKQVPRAVGRIDIPDTKAIVLLGTIALLGIAYLIMGRMRIAAGRSGQTIVRFKAYERFSHWLTAVSFVVLGLTGLNITFGKIVLLPLIGPQAFSSVAEIAKYVHNFTSFSFVA